ncbi:MAG: type II toxin-antitoxin system RelE/ParE family toxin [Candidatus Limnocylindrales bacterium]
MPHRVVLTPAAQRQADRLRGVPLIALRGVILGLTDDPRPSGVVKLAGGIDLWRLRIGIDGQSWRVIYRIDNKAKLVIITRIARRDEGTYRRI